MHNKETHGSGRRFQRNSVRGTADLRLSMREQRRSHGWRLVSASLLCWIAVTASAAPPEKCSREVEDRRNRDGSRIHLVATVCPPSGERSAVVTFRPKGARKRVQVGSFVLPPAFLPNSGITLDDWDNDGEYEVHVADDCGVGANCEGEILRLDRGTLQLQTFFRGTVSSVSLLSGHLVEGARDSCCTWWHTVYMLYDDRRRVAATPEFSVFVEAPESSARNAPSKCTFFKPSSDGRDVIAPPAKAFLRLCKHYGGPYRVVKPQ